MRTLVLLALLAAPAAARSAQSG